MRFLTLICVFMSLAGCSYLGSLEPDISVTVTSVENLDEGVLVRFTVDDDGDEIEFAGAAIDRAGRPFNIRANQEIASGAGRDFEVLLIGSDDGNYLVQAFAVVEGFYALSEPVPVEVISSIPDAPCTPPVNSMRAYLSQCDAGELRVTNNGGGSGSTYEVTGTCSGPGKAFGQVKLEFPRDPTSGVYRVVSGFVSSGTRDKVVSIQLQVGMFLTNVAAGQEVYVQRQGDRTLITLCNLDFPYQTIRSNITARLRVAR